MTQARLKAPRSWDRAFYHCVSRVVDRRFIFDDSEHAEFLRIMRQYERLCQVKVLTYCLMSNHFHLLVEVPSRPPEGMSEEALIQVLHSCFGREFANKVALELSQCHSSGDEEGAGQIMEGWLSRMWDISAFMKAVKQKFSQWYNSRNDRVGTLWECRFKSAIIQSGHALLTVATYIDLNPVRAKIVTDPRDYRWCGYAAALGGVKQAFQGIHRVVSLALEWSNLKGKGWESIEQYQVLLYLTDKSRTRKSRSNPRENQSNRHSTPSEQVESVERQSGKLSHAEMLRCRVRYFIDGCVIGSREFVDEVFQSYRERFGRKRKAGARPMRGADFGSLCSLRDLRVRAIES